MTNIKNPIHFKSIKDLMIHYGIDENTLVSSKASYVKFPKIHHSLLYCNPDNEFEVSCIEFAKDVYGELTACAPVIANLSIIKAKLESFREQAAKAEAYDTCNLFFNIIGEDQYRITVMAKKLVELGEKDIEVSLQSTKPEPNAIESLLDKLDIDTFIKSFD
ncbi:hypothetical protein OTK49_28415 [Vibrio coralliirubri]|uniref:hypothetical protein n=1 Tax=Vibrio coralliirubri TaxID=1516159 RepID=UPI0022834D71|nr:hypothetical protein [Vibrio coralliirubri]MCY9866468.1 hypothetical protein [Vibrio coralliirubri]